MSAEQASGSALTRCLQEEAAAIAAAAERLDGAHVEAALALLEGCRARRAKLVVSGVGKSGIVARKIAANFSAIGLTAVYLSPVDALHGDLGIVAADDVVLLVSNSGETDELLAILPHLKRRGTARIALVGRVHSSLARGCDVVLDGSVDREICPLNLAPTASTAVTMAIGDALAAVWMERSGVSAADFAVNHPAGALGRKLTLCASDLMVPARDIEPLERHSALDDVIRVLTNAFPGTAWVTDAARRGVLSGIITDGDLRRALKARGSPAWEVLRAADVMTTDPICITADVLAVDALKIMEVNGKKSVSALPVIERDAQGTPRLLGIVSLHALLKAGL